MEGTIGWRCTVGRNYKCHSGCLQLLLRINYTTELSQALFDRANWIMCLKFLIYGFGCCPFLINFHYSRCSFASVCFLSLFFKPNNILWLLNIFKLSAEIDIIETEIFAFDFGHEENEARKQVSLRKRLKVEIITMCGMKI